MVERIEKIVNGEVTRATSRYTRDGGEFYECFEPGATRDPVWFSTLTEVAAYLRAKPNRRVRMEPGSAMISRHIYIDGIEI